jgi:rRNA maturation endonuclease Nob1
MKVIQSSMNWIKKQFSKKEYNYQNTQTMELVKDTVIKYQWKKGDNFGKVVEVKDSDGEFTYFTDGSQIFNNVLSEFLEKVEGDQLPFPGAQSLNDIAAGIQTKQTPTKKEVVKEVQAEPEKSALEELVAKLSKKNMEPFQTTINLNIPNRQIFDMLIDNADEDRENLIKTIAAVAVSQIEINKLQEYLTEQVTIFINNYYNGENNNNV